MNKSSIKTFAINSRKKLIEDVEYKMSLVGITKDHIDEPASSAEGIETYNIGGSTNSIYDKDIEKRIITIDKIISKAKQIFKLMNKKDKNVTQKIMQKKEIIWQKTNSN